MLEDNPKSPLRLDEEMYKILNFTKFKIIEYVNTSIESVEQ